MQPELEERPVAQPTRKALLDVATEIFFADGFKAARVADIARQAGVRLFSCYLGIPSWRAPSGISASR